MTDNAKMVDLPWHDGTTRTVPEGTVYETKFGLVRVALDGGYSDGPDPEKLLGKSIYTHISSSFAVRIFTEAPEPPVKVTVPTGLGAIVSLPTLPNDPGFVLTREGWLGLNVVVKFDPSEISGLLHDGGARVLYEGDDRKAAPEPPLPELPTNTGAIIAEFLRGKATYWSVRLDHDDKWRSEGVVYPKYKLRQMLRDGYAKVVFTGEGTPAPESGE